MTMSALDRIKAVLYHKKPDKVPFVPNCDLIPRGESIRELRNRGMGMCTTWTQTCWSGWPNVRFKTKTRGSVTITIWDTPVGSVSSWCRTHLDRKVSSRELRGKRLARKLEREGRIKQIEDYDPVIFVIEDEKFYEDYVNYDYTTRDFGEDCLVRVAGLYAPYETSYNHFGPAAPQGLTNWIYTQQDHPEQFKKLLEALERREERRFQVIKDSPGEVMCLKGMGGWYGPEQFKKYMVPFFKKYVPLLRSNGRILCLNAHATNLSAFKDLIPQTGVDVIDGFTPPPIGDLSIQEARAAWGDQITIWVNFPETIFWEGPEVTKDYTLKLLRSDPSGNLVIGMSVMGTSMVTDDETHQIFNAGMEAIMDAIDEFSGL